MDLAAGYAHGHWPAEFVDLLLPRVIPTLATRLDGEISVQVQTTDRDPPVTAAAADLETTCSGQAGQLPRLRAWA